MTASARQLCSAFWWPRAKDKNCVKETGQEGNVHVCVISPLGASLYGSEVECAGGAEFQLFLLAHALAGEEGYKVSVLVTVNDVEGSEQVGRLTLVKRRSGGRLIQKRWYSAPNGIVNYLAAFVEMLALFRSINADVYIHAGAGVEVGAYAAICRFLKKRFVFVVASSADVREVAGGVTSPLQWLYPLGVRYAHVVVCRSTEQQEWLRARFHKEGVLIKTAHAERTERNAGRVFQEKETLLWVGRVVPLKRPQLFLDVARHYPQVPCTMVIKKDDGHPDLWSEIRTQAATIPNLCVHENMPWHEMDSFYESAKVLVCTSEYEGFPNTFVQAAMVRTPILSLAVDPDGVLTRQGIGACAGGSFAQLLRLVQQFLASGSLRRECGHRAYRYAMEHHQLSEAVKRFKGVIHDVLKSKEKAGVVS